jgi:hypothetical protein
MSIPILAADVAAATAAVVVDAIDMSIILMDN